MTEKKGNLKNIYTNLMNESTNTVAFGILRIRWGGSPGDAGQVGDLGKPYRVPRSWAPSAIICFHGERLSWSET